MLREQKRRRANQQAIASAYSKIEKYADLKMRYCLYRANHSARNKAHKMRLLADSDLFYRLSQLVKQKTAKDNARYYVPAFKVVDFINSNKPFFTYSIDNENRRGFLNVLTYALVLIAGIENKLQHKAPAQDVGFSSICDNSLDDEL